MQKIVILTATYNHPTEIKRLFQTLEKQKNKNFTWIIVNDGSKEETIEVLRTIKDKSTIDLNVINQENRGKSSAINNGLNSLSENAKIVVIVDDDERLHETAIQTINDYYEKYKNTECGVIHFNRLDENGDIIAKPIINQDFYKSFQAFKLEKRHADGYIGYFIDKLGKERFTINEGEKYVAPSTLIMKVTKNSKLLWAKENLGQTEYLEGGITKQGRKLRIKNPQGMIEYCTLMCEGNCGIKQKIEYSILGYAYMEFCKEKKQKNNNNFIILGKIPGIIIAKMWKNKYMR